MDLYDEFGDDEELEQIFQPMNESIHFFHPPPSTVDRLCVICGSKSVGTNFGVLTCAPCKAFFRRNARRRELLELPCRHRDLGILLRNNLELNERTARYLQIRRCSSCRLRRCYEVGMKEELVRTEEENDRHRQLVNLNRKRRDFFKNQSLEMKQISIPNLVMNNSKLTIEIDWRHLSNIVYAYDAYCSKAFAQQREEIIFNKASQTQEEQTSNRHPTTLTMCLVLAISAFLKSLPAFKSLPRSTRTHLCKTNIRPLMFPNVYELNQSCFSEPWQIAAYKATWELICGTQLYVQFVHIEQLTAKLWITDPIVTRLWIIVLFFSTPLHYHHDSPTPTPLLKKQTPIRQAQNAYVTLLWKYLLHRYGDAESVRIYSNLVCVYTRMQSVGYGINAHLRSQQELVKTHETLHKLVTVDVNDDQVNSE